MKNRSPLSIAIFFIATTVVANACDNQKRIPYNEGRVEPHIVSVRTAASYTASYRRGKTELQNMLRDPAYLDKNFQIPVAVQFNRDVIALLLSQKDSTGKLADGIRMYFGRNDQGQVTLVLVPIDARNRDILNQLINKDVVSIPGIPSANAQPRNAQAVDNALRCPTFCDQMSVLNGL